MRFSGCLGQYNSDLAVGSTDNNLPICWAVLRDGPSNAALENGKLVFRAVLARWTTYTLSPVVGRRDGCDGD